MKKRGEPSDNSGNLLPPLNISLLQPLEEHAGRLKRDNSDLLYTCDAPNTSSWFSSQPKDESPIGVVPNQLVEIKKNT